MDMYSLAILSPQKLGGIAKELSQNLKHDNKDILINANEFHSLNSFMDYIEKEEGPNFILVFESIHAFKLDREKARSETLEALKKIKFRVNAKIMIVIQKEKEEEALPFINGLMKLDLQDFYLEDEISIPDILKLLFCESKQLKDNLKYLTTDLSQKEIIKEIQVPAPIPTQAVDLEKEKEPPLTSETTVKKAHVDSAAQPMEAESKAAHLVIGIIGAAKGSGATSLCLNYAAYLKTLKKKVLLLDRTDNKHLTHIDMQGIERKSCPLYEIDVYKYDVTLIDFGTLAEVSCDGMINPRPDMANEKRMERQFCHKIIFVASNLPWRLFELKAYIEDEIFSNLTEDWLFYLNGEDFSVFDNLKKAYEKKRTLFLPHKYDNPYQELNEILNRRS